MQKKKHQDIMNELKICMSWFFIKNIKINNNYKTIQNDVTNN